MGVFSLMHYVLDHRDTCTEFVDLIEISSQKGGVEILVDYYSFQQMLMLNFFKSLSSCSGNPYLKLLGGEYGAIDAFVSKLVSDLKALSINLVMFVDGSKGSSRIGTQQKLETWKHRHENDVKKLAELIDVITGNKNIQDLSQDTAIRPVLVEIQIFDTLRKCDVEIIQLSSGEADAAIAKNLQGRPKAYAIYSNDTDFCIFQNCKVIFQELFDIHKNLQLGSDKQWLPDKPTRLVCGIVSSEKLQSHLGLSEWGMLTEVAILAGNDFTRSYTRHLKSRVGVYSKDIGEVAKWVQTHRRIENHQIIAQEMRHNQEFRTSVQRSRQFYNLSLLGEEQTSRGYVTRLLEETIEKGKFPATLMGMHNNFYWHRMLLEDTAYGSPCVEIALSELRSYLYRMVLSRQENVVVEYGRNPWEEFSSTRVYAAEDKKLTAVNYINSEKIFQNLKTFHYIMMHREPYFPIYLFDRYGRKNGFICLILRYMASLNNGKNLHLSVDEFMALVACVYCRVDEPWYCGLSILPTLRCVTVANWFQDIYRHAYQFLGCLLYLTHEFPLPKDIFSGSVFSAFYMVLQNQGMLVNKGFPRDWMQRIKSDINYIIGEKRHVIKHLVEDIFEFSTDFRFYVR